MNNSIKKFTCLVSLLFILSQLYSQNVGINSSGAVPAASAMLDIVATDKGLLIPRVALTATNVAGPVTSPATSLLVYNTATDGTSPNNVVPGYYYWDGSQWIPFIKLGEGSITSKTADATLLKTETFVVASNDITLTLPAITALDNGLSITIKNIGTHIHQVDVVPSGGSTIDGLLTSKHFRWTSKTYVASGGNWLIKGNEGKADNFFDVSAGGSWTTIEEVIEFLNAHMEAPSIVRLISGDYTITSTQTINLPHPVTFQGSSYGAATIIADAGLSGPMFLCESETYFKMLAFDAGGATSADAIHLDTNPEYYEIKDCTIDGFEKGIVALTNVEFWVFEVDITNASVAGIEIAAGVSVGASLKISETDFIDCATGINLLSGDDPVVSILSCGFYNPTGGTGINYVPADFTLTPLSTLFVTNNTWNNIGTFMSGFDFSRSDGRDANTFIQNNSGGQNQNPHCRINVTDNTTLTAITQDTWTKATWDAGKQSSTTTKWTVGTNRITYQPVNKSNGWSLITGNITATSGNETVLIAIVKNNNSAVRFGETALRIVTSGQPYQFSTSIYFSNTSPTDYYEIWVYNDTSGADITFNDVQWFTETK